MSLRLIGLSCVVLSCLGGCSESAEPSVNPAVDCSERALKIQGLEQGLFRADEDLSPNQKIRGQLMAEYAAFSNHCHDNSQTAEMLFRRADLLRSAGRFQEAMTQLRDVHDYFPEYEKRAICAFLVGFIAEVELNDREQAKKTYEQVIALHDTTDAAEWSRQALANLQGLQQ